MASSRGITIALDVFVHINHVHGKIPLTPGQRVNFTLGQNKKGLVAQHVTILAPNEENSGPTSSTQTRSQ